MKKRPSSMTQKNSNKPVKAASGGSLVYFLLLLLVISMTDFLYYLINGHLPEAFFSITTCFCAFLLPLYFFRNHMKTYLRFLLPVLLLVPFSVGGIVLFNLPVTDGVVLAIVNTTRAEAGELLHNYLFLFLGVLLFLALTYIVLYRRTPPNISARISAGLSLCSLIILLLLPLADRDKQSHPHYFQRLRGRIYATFPFSIAYCSGLVYRQYHLIGDTRRQREEFRFGASQSSLQKTRQVYVLIIGESSRYDHWALNGYPRNTSPKLSRRPNLLSFSQTVAGACFTEFSVPQIITCATADHFEDHYRQRSVLEAFRESGFTTYWITDQFDQGHIKMHQGDADHLYQYSFLDPNSAKSLHHTDMELLASLKTVLSDTASKKFILIHTMGSHFDYSARYPDGFDQFRPSLKTVAAQPNDFSKKDILINSYDNSILFSDSFIDSTIGMVNGQHLCASVFYISDHGENLFDDDRKISLHAEVTPTAFTAHVPFFIWYSDSLRNHFPDKIRWLVSHRDYKTAAEDIVPTLTDLCDIHFPLQDPSKCLDANTFRNSRQLLVGSGMVLFQYDSMANRK